MARYEILFIVLAIFVFVFYFILTLGILSLGIGIVATIMAIICAVLEAFANMRKNQLTRELESLGR